jgi:hypothetical protein
MLREDLNARFLFDRKGFLFEQRCWFLATGRPPTRIAADRYEHLRAAQAEKPVRVVYDDQRQWWWYQGQFYWENEGYEAVDVLALIRDRQRRKERKLERAHTMLTLDRDPTPQRAPIPQEVRRAVFERDGGCCVQCGSTFDLQYDHILPFSLGGATTVENLQVLCADCNREKSDSI